MINPILVFTATFDTDIKIAIMYLFLYYPTMSCQDIVRLTGEKKENIITSLWRLQMDTIVVNHVEDDRNTYYSLTSSGTDSLKVFSQIANFSSQCLK
jgi:DNA-binding HxlR family transcriptional regulator